MKIGQEVFLERIGNSARHTKEPIKTTITKIGRKYITVEYFDARFFISDMTHFNGDYSGNYILHLTEVDLKNKIECEELGQEVRQHFQYWRESRFSLDQLKRINEIIKEDK